MADSTCLIHGFSYASAIPNESKQGNPMHVLGESISFGRFMNESLSWERWSTFSPHKKYVEEAQRYAQPGSVAQKKVFFEAHYKKIAAQKAAALQEQESAAKSDKKEDDELSDAVSASPQQIGASGSCLSVDVKSEEEVAQTEDVVKINGVVSEDANHAIYAEKIASDIGCSTTVGDDKLLQESPAKRNSIKHSNNLDKRDSLSVSESSGTSQIERPLLKYSSAKEDDVNDDATSAPSKKRTSCSSLRSSIQRKTWRVPPSTPVNLVTAHSKIENAVTQHMTKSDTDLNTDKETSSPKSLRSLISLLTTKDPDKELISVSTKQTQNSGLPRGSYSVLTKYHPTPLRTPHAGNKISSKYTAATPQSENKRMQTPVNPSAPGGKTGPRRHIFSAIYSKSLSACRNKLQSPTLSSPFILRTEERAAKRKQKLEEKFNSSEAQRVTQQQKTLKDKAGDEIRKLGCGFCFKARPLPDFYRERETHKKLQLKKIEATPSQPSVPVKSTSNKTKGTFSSMPPPPPPPTVSVRNSVASKSVSTKSLATTTTYSLGERIAHENESPNIQL